MKRGQAIALAVTAAALLAAVGIAWWLQASSVQGYQIVVTRDGRELAGFDLEELRALPQSKVVVDGKTESGPALGDVLKAAGVSNFTSVTVRGMGLRDSGTITLLRAEVGPDVLLDFAQRGTMKVVSPDLAWEARVRDVTGIEVR
jgi:hypothetical protein